VIAENYHLAEKNFNHVGYLGSKQRSDHLLPKGRQSPRNCPLAAKGAATDEVEVGLEKARHFFQTCKSVSNAPNLSLGSEADQVSRKT